MTVNFLMVEIEKGLSSLGNFNKIHASRWYSVQTTSITGHLPLDKEENNEFAWH